MLDFTGVNLILILSIMSIIIPSHTVIFAQEIVPQSSNPNQFVQLVTSGLDAPTTMAFLGPSDILVAQKNDGTIKRIVNGEILEQPVLDVNVNAKDERGMLGIATTKNITTGKTYVYLFYTESEGDDGAEPIGNRLYRYELVDNKLVNPKLLLDLPYLPGPAHNGGVISIGPDNNVYVAIGELMLIPS